MKDKNVEVLNVEVLNYSIEIITDANFFIRLYRMISLPISYIFFGRFRL